MKTPIPIVVLRGGGDQASGVALRLHRAGITLIITEIERPLAVRRLVSFAEAVYRGAITVEGINARRVENPAQVEATLAKNEIPVLIDPNAKILQTINHYSTGKLATDTSTYNLIAMIDARMTKRPPDLGLEAAPLVIGLGPGFIAPENCHAAIETNRGHFLGRVFWQGAPESDTGIPGAVANHQSDRVLRAPVNGVLQTQVEIGSLVQAGEILAEIAGVPIRAPFEGVLRGMLHDGLSVQQGIKIGDVDPRNDPRLACMVSEKSLAVGGGVLEALLTRPEIRSQLWN